MQRLKNRRTRQIVKVGDELHHGQKFACVPDLCEMKVNTTVNETDIGKIHLDQRVIVRLDAFPDKPFDGKIIEIGKVSYKKDEKSRTKVFDIVILLDKSNPILKPGMTVSCEIITSELDDVYYVENDCILKQDQKYYIFMNRNGKNEKCSVQIGPRNNQFTVIYGDFKAGQRILPLNQIKNNQIAKVGI